MSEHGDVGRLEAAVATAVDRPIGQPPAVSHVVGRARRRRRTKAAVLVGSLAVGGLAAGATWGGDDDSTPVVANAPQEADESAAIGRLRLDHLTAVAGDGGHEQVDIVVEGTPPNPTAIAVGSLDEAGLEQISYYVATSDGALSICDSSHSWGGANAAVGVTIPLAWFDPEPTRRDSPLVATFDDEGRPAPIYAKVIDCPLESGLWQLTIHGPRSGSIGDVSVEFVDGVIRVVIDDPMAVEASDLWLRREAGVVVGDTLVVPGLAQRNPTAVHLLAVDLTTGEERVIAAPDGLLIGEQAPVWAEPRPILTVWQDRVVVCCSGFGGGSISLYDPTGDSWTPLADLPGDFLDAVVVTERGLLALGRDGAALLGAPDGLWQVLAESPPAASDAHRFWTASAIGEAVLFWPVHFSRNIELGFVLDLTTGAWQAVPAPEDDFLVPAAATSVVADGRFLLVGGQPEVSAELSEALVVLTLDPQTLAWAEPQFPLPEPDSFEGNIGPQRLLPSADGRLVFDTGALGGDVSLLEIDAATGVASAITVADPADVIAVRADGALVRRPQPQ